MLRIVNPWPRWVSLLNLALLAFFILRFFLFLRGLAQGPPIPAFIAIAAVLGYVGVAYLLNSTTVEAQAGWLTVTHGPVPWLGGTRIPLEDLEQVFCTEIAETRKGRRTTNYDLVALRRDGRRVNLVRGFDTLDHALEFEARIEKYAGIRDRTVPGEAG